MLLELFPFLLLFQTISSDQLVTSFRSLPNEKLEELVEPHENYTRHVLDQILIERVVGSANHAKVHQFIVGELKASHYEVETDEFTAKVPIFGQLTFKNVIATLNPHAERFIVLACHYDSKYFPNEVFVGATDSAVPCAMLLNIARTLNVSEYRNRAEIGVKLVFFDGEEAFELWGPNDSIYGAKHLAQKFKGTRRALRGGFTDDVRNIDVLILLDLLGAENPTFSSYFPDTQRLYVRLAKIEEQLYNLGLLENYTQQYFLKRRLNARIEDDHIPFLKLGVPILHLIPTPFPSFWHTNGDNADIIHMPTVTNLNLILKIFICEYLQTVIADEVPDVPEKEL